MPRQTTRDEVRNLVERGAQLVDVLPPDEYKEEHLAGAINIPLTRLTEESVVPLTRERPVVVYCHDYQ